MLLFGNDWDEILADDFKSESYLSLRQFLKSEYSSYNVFPDMHNIFNCFKTTPFSNLKVVILGQDPYHEKGQAMGLSFSVPKGIPLPPSLQNIYKELSSDLSITPSKCGDLTKWAKQGVLLLNTVMTVREGQANSHKNKGWEFFTDSVISKISKLKENVVFILWGANARSKKALIDKDKHLILESVHPSPLSCYNGFFGCKHFSKTNAYLKARNLSQIDWDLNI